MTSIFSDQVSRVGERVGNYSLVRFIGAGGMGEVYEARHTTLGTRQAIKFLRRDLVRRFDLYARFEQEAQIASTLENRHIVKVRDFRLADDGTPYMVMDLAEGRSLASILAECGRLGVLRAVNLVHQACVGLCVAHTARIVHRDLKPENLYVCPESDGTELLKILDFGIAKHLGAGDSGPTTETGSNLGTAHYMSPEQAQGARHAIDHRTDIYSLGVILYELLSGRRPHDGESYNEILIRIVTQQPLPLDALCPSLPRELVSIVDRAMQREPLERFQAAADFADALARLRANSVESTGVGIALQPATRPRGSEQVTLASGPNGHPPASNRAPASNIRHSDALLPTALQLDARLARQRPWYSNLGLQFFLAVLAAAAITSALLWLPGPSRLGPVTSPNSVRTIPTALRPLASDALGSIPTSGNLPAAPEVPSRSARTSAKTSSATSTQGLHAGRSQVFRPTSSWSDVPTAAALPNEESTTPKAPTIDEPLPQSPHAPGVSREME